MGDLDFIKDALLSDEINRLYNKEWFPESLYLLAMVDYLCRVNDLPLAQEYNKIRKAKLSEVAYPAGILALSIFGNTDEYKELSVSEAIPEFIRHNIVENEVRNVI